VNETAIVLAAMLRNHEATGLAAERLESPELVQAMLTLLHQLAERGVDVVSLMHLLTEAIDTGEPDRRLILELLP
jgi:hypothetical protein